MLIDVPCCIGDTVYGVKKNGGGYYPSAGTVSRMELVRLDKSKREMTLVINLHYQCKGVWGKTIFGNRDDCIAECDRRNAEGKDVTGHDICSRF